MMKVTYTPHAVQRMQEREISPKEVQQILEKPDGKIAQSNDKWIYYKEFRSRKDNYLAAVTVQKKGQLFEVLTVMVNFEVRK